MLQKISTIEWLVLFCVLNEVNFGLDKISRDLSLTEASFDSAVDRGALSVHRKQQNCLYNYRILMVNT